MVYLIRHCLHNYNDAAATRVIRQVVPPLESCSQSSLPINKVVLPNVTEVTRSQLNDLRQFDIRMMVTNGGKQRTDGEWIRLVNNADPRLEIVTMGKKWVGLGMIEVKMEVTK